MKIKWYKDGCYLKLNTFLGRQVCLCLTVSLSLSPSLSLSLECVA